MRDPYLYSDADVLINNGDIKEPEKLKEAETAVTKFTMALAYSMKVEKFNSDTVCDIHKTIFGDLYPWAGQFRTIHIAKYEEVLGGDTVRYTTPDLIESELDEVSKEISRLTTFKGSKEELITRIARTCAKIWEIHPFREGNTRTVVVFSVLLAQSLGLKVDYSLFEKHSAYVRNSFVWACQGIYSKYEYIDRIYMDAMGGTPDKELSEEKTKNKSYETINGYEVKNYKETPHVYVDKEF